MTAPATDHSGPYEVVRALGGGAEATVFAARDTRDEKVVSLRRLHRERTRHIEDGIRFLRESRVLAELTHPAIPRLLDTGVDTASRLYLVTEYAPGRSLREEIEALHVADPSEQQRGVRRLLSAMHAVGSALQHAHQRGVMHGDIAPSNVVVDELGAAKLIDWSLSLRDGEAPATVRRGLRHATQRKNARRRQFRIVGTPGYVAPERLKNEQAPWRISGEIWAFAAVVYECLSLEPAFRGDSPFVRAAVTLSMEPVPPNERRPELGLPAALCDAVMACLVSDPEQRPASLDALLDALDGARTPAE